MRAYPALPEINLPTNLPTNLGANHAACRALCSRRVVSGVKQSNGDDMFSFGLQHMHAGMGALSFTASAAFYVR